MDCLPTVYGFAQAKGLFQLWEAFAAEERVSYSPADTLKNVWASIVVGCGEYYDLNSRTWRARGRHWPKVFRMERSRSSNRVNRMLNVDTADRLRYREQHFELLCRHTRARSEVVGCGTRLRKAYLMADIDQRVGAFPVSIRGGRERLFGRHREQPDSVRVCFRWGDRRGGG